MSDRATTRRQTQATGSGQAMAAGRDDGGPNEPLRIGDVAARAAVTVETLRYYERRGLVRPARRLRSGYREYTADAVGVVRFIKRAQSLGFTLAEVEELVRLRERAWSGDATHLLRDAVVAKTEDIERRMRELRALADELGDMVAACDAACPEEPADAECDTLAAARNRVPASTRLANALDCPLVEALDPKSLAGTVEVTPPSSDLVENRTADRRRRDGGHR
ncbi:MAG TPA: MerR family transcriptional regulator [Longimicrobiales bacterium]|nr:MerR family transcriptional regulator [Longimicrobiales bacterium]